MACNPPSTTNTAPPRTSRTAVTGLFIGIKITENRQVSFPASSFNTARLPQLGRLLPGEV